MANQRMTSSPTVARRAGNGLSGSGSQASDQVKDTARQTASQVTDTAKQTVSQATDSAKQQADRQLDKVSDGLEQVAQTLHQTGDSLRQNDQAMVGGYVDKAAGQLERVSDYLRMRSVEEIVDDVQSYARREPVVTVGVALGLGFVAARLLKASMGRSNRGGQLDARYRTPAYYADASDGVLHEEYGTPGAVGNRYGNGA